MLRTTASKLISCQAVNDGILPVASNKVAASRLLRSGGKFYKAPFKIFPPVFLNMAPPVGCSSKAYKDIYEME